MNRAILKLAAAVLVAVFWAGCGGSSSNTQTKPVSHINNRLFVSNQQTGFVQIVDATLDQVATPNFWISILGSPSMMDSASDNKNIAVYDSSFNSVTVINTDTENTVNRVSLDAASDSIRITSDASFVFAAVRNRLNTSPIPPGAVQQVDVTNAVIKANFPVPNARWLALDHGNKNLLVFSDTSDTPYHIDLTATTPTAVPIPGPYSRPVAAYFTSDDTKAYILSCGLECGGGSSQVTELTLASGATRVLPVAGATIGALDGTTLYVAGAPGGTGGVLTEIDTATMSVKSTANIGTGYHQVMRVAASKVWVGARNCGGGCLSVFDPSTGNVIVDNPVPPEPSKGNVTGMDFDRPNNQMYVCEGGELLRYDTNGNPVNTLVDIVGNAFDVRAVLPSP